MLTVIQIKTWKKNKTPACPLGYTLSEYRFSCSQVFLHNMFIFIHLSIIQGLISFWFMLFGRVLSIFRYWWRPQLVLFPILKKNVTHMSLGGKWLSKYFISFPTVLTNEFCYSPYVNRFLDRHKIIAQHEIRV